MANTDESTGTTGLKPSAEYRLRRYEIRLGFWKVIWGTTLVGVIATLLPALVEVYKKYAEGFQLEAQRKLESERFELEKTKFYQDFLKDFAEKGYNQDIELRIRLAEYFATVSDETFAARWAKFLDVLSKRRNALYEKIDSLLEQIATEKSKAPPNQVLISKLENDLYRIQLQTGPLKLELANVPSASAPVSSTLLSANLAPPSTEKLPASRLLGAFGPPAKNVGQDCGVSDNMLLSQQIATEPVGSFSATMLKPALSSLRTILGQVQSADPGVGQGIRNEGGLCVRLVRGSTLLSPHAFGTAIDLSIDGMIVPTGVNPTGDRGDKLRKLATYFENAGWIWGGRDRVPDPMHFEVGLELFEQWVSAGAVKTLQKP